jgi:hypothetical protein
MNINPLMLKIMVVVIIVLDVTSVSKKAIPYWEI